MKRLHTSARGGTEKSGYGWADDGTTIIEQSQRGYGHLWDPIRSPQLYGLNTRRELLSMIASNRVQGHDRTFDRTVAGLMWYPSPSINGSSPWAQGRQDKISDSKGTNGSPELREKFQEESLVRFNGIGFRSVSIVEMALASIGKVPSLT